MIKKFLKTMLDYLLMRKEVKPVGVRIIPEVRVVLTDKETGTVATATGEFKDAKQSCIEALERARRDGTNVGHN